MYNFIQKAVQAALCQSQTDRLLAAYFILSMRLILPIKAIRLSSLSRKKVLPTASRDREFLKDANTRMLHANSWIGRQQKNSATL